MCASLLMLLRQYSSSFESSGEHAKTRTWHEKHKIQLKEEPRKQNSGIFMNFFIHTNIHTYCLSQKCNWDSLWKNWKENIFSCNSNLAHNWLLFSAAVRIVLTFVLKAFLELLLVLKLSSINFCYLWQQLKIKRQP